MYLKPDDGIVRVRLNTNIRKLLKKRLMIYCAENEGVYQYEVVELALETILDQLGAKREDEI